MNPTTATPSRYQTAIAARTVAQNPQEVRSLDMLVPGLTTELMACWDCRSGLNLRHIASWVLELPDFGPTLTALVDSLSPDARGYAVKLPELTGLTREGIWHLLNGLPRAGRVDLLVTRQMLDARNRFDLTGVTAREGGHALLLALHIACTVEGTLVLAPGMFSAAAVSGPCTGWTVEQLKLQFTGHHDEAMTMMVQVDALPYEPDLNDFPSSALAGVETAIQACPTRIALRAGELQLDPQDGLITFNGQQCALSRMTMAWLSVMARPQDAPPDGLEHWDVVRARLELSDASPRCLLQDYAGGPMHYRLDLASSQAGDSYRLSTVGGPVEVTGNSIRFGQQMTSLTPAAVRLLTALCDQEKPVSQILRACRHAGLRSAEVSSALDELRIKPATIGCALIQLVSQRAELDGSNVIRLFRACHTPAHAMSFCVNAAAVSLMHALTLVFCPTQTSAWLEANLPLLTNKLLARWSPESGLDLRDVPRYILDAPGMEHILAQMVDTLSPGARGYAIHRDPPPSYALLKAPEGYVDVTDEALKFHHRTVKLSVLEAELMRCFLQRGAAGRQAFMDRGCSPQRFNDVFSSLYAKTRELGCTLFEFESDPEGPSWGVRCMYVHVGAAQLAWASPHPDVQPIGVALHTPAGVVSACATMLRFQEATVHMTPNAAKLLECLIDYEDSSLALRVFTRNASNRDAIDALGELRRAGDRLGCPLISIDRHLNEQAPWLDVRRQFSLNAPA